MQTEIIAEPDKQEIFFIRDFDAPRELVFQAYADPKWYVQWTGSQELISTLEPFKPEEASGGWRLVQKSEDGKEYKSRGVNHETVFPERIISTFEFEGLLGEGHVALETVIFEDLPDERTIVTDQCVFQSVVDRDALIELGIVKSVSDSHDRLDKLLDREFTKIKAVKSFKNMFSRLWRF